jgi:hypothetical protein
MDAQSASQNFPLSFEEASDILYRHCTIDEQTRVPRTVQAWQTLDCWRAPALGLSGPSQCLTFPLQSARLGDDRQPWTRRTRRVKQL